MRKKFILGIILTLVISTLIIILIFKTNTRYNEFIIDEDKWNEIIKSKVKSDNLKLSKIKFNDYNLLIDNKNNIIYYSVVNTSQKYNPIIKYQGSSKISLAVNGLITSENLEQNDDLKIIIYNDKEYQIYSLVITDYPILNISIKDEKQNDKKKSVYIELFANQIGMPLRILTSDGKLQMFEKDKYGISLVKKSLGNNIRENYVSIFGMKKDDKYILTKANKDSQNERNVLLFINNEYQGLYTINPKERRINNYERNKENNH